MSNFYSNNNYYLLKKWKPQRVCKLFAFCTHSNGSHRGYANCLHSVHIPMKATEGTQTACSYSVHIQWKPQRVCKLFAFCTHSNGSHRGYANCLHSVHIPMEATEGTQTVCILYTFQWKPQRVHKLFAFCTHATLLRNIQHLCPSILINIYRVDVALYIEGSTLLSEEGTTQGDPLAMPMYALGVLPLIDCISGDLMQVWYADDATACGSLSELHLWWDKLLQFGPDWIFSKSIKDVFGCEGGIL